MVNKDKVDFYYWPMDIFDTNLTDNQNVGLSKVTSTAPINVGQILRKPNKFNKLDFSSFLIENIGLMVIILIGYFFILMAIFTLLKLIKQRYSLYYLLTIDGSRLSSISFKISILLLTFSIFLFFNLSILTNMIKTQKVIVSTSEFIDSISKLNKTTKTLVTMHQSFTNLFYRLLKKSKRNDSLSIASLVDFEGFYSKISKKGFDFYFYFMREIYFFLLVYYVTLLNRSVDYFVFFKPTIYFESLRSIFYRKNLGEKMKKILNRR